MQRLVRDEVRSHIPRGDYAQNEFRMNYAVQRQYDLARNPDCPAAVSLTRAAASVGRRHPGFRPAYDQAHFTGRTQ